MSTKLVVIDVDGVLNSAAWFDRKPDGVLFAADPVAVARLNRILLQTSADLVMSSAWRTWDGLPSVAHAAGILRGFGVAGRVVGVTPALDDAQRGDEIEKWLIEKTRGPVYLAVLDDDGDMGAVSDHLIQTSFETGLLDVHVDAAIELLTNGPTWSGY